MASKGALSRPRRTRHDNDVTVHGSYESRNRSPRPLAPPPGISTRASPLDGPRFQITLLATICYGYKTQTSGRRRGGFRFWQDEATWPRSANRADLHHRRAIQKWSACVGEQVSSRVTKMHLQIRYNPFIQANQCGGPLFAQC